MKKNLSACTTVLVGKNATIDGSTMAARNDDTFGPLTPQRFVTYPAYHNQPNQVKAYLNKCVVDRPADGYRYQGAPRKAPILMNGCWPLILWLKIPASTKI